MGKANIKDSGFSLFFSLVSLALSNVLYGQTNAIAIPLDTSYTVWSAHQKLIKEYPNIKPALPVESPLVVQKNDIVYLTIENTSFGLRELHADVFMPAKKTKLFPAVLLVHGGGWRAGNRTLNTPMAQRLAARGYVVISVEYRLSLEAKYPAAVSDLKAAIRWIRANAKVYHVDEKHVAIAGSSAGGQLASLIGATNGNDKFEGLAGNLKYSSSVQAVVDMDGLLDFTDPENLVLKRNDNSADVFWLDGYYEKNSEKWKQASALHWVNKQSPPYLFIKSSQTRFHAGCDRMVTQLNSLGIYNEVHELTGAPHSYWLFHPWFDPTIELITDFLNKVFNER